MKAILLTTQCGDFEGVFLGKQLIEEGHTIGEGDSIRWWLDFGQKYDIGASDLAIRELNDIDNEMLMNDGGFPRDIDALDGVYS